MGVAVGAAIGMVEGAGPSVGAGKGDSSALVASRQEQAEQAVLAEESLVALAPG